MDITCEPKSPGLTLGETSAEQKYVIRGTAEKVDAITALSETAPLFEVTHLGLLIRNGVEVEEEYIDEVNPDACIWTGTAQYVSPTGSTSSVTPREIGSVSVRISTRGGTQHMTTSLATVAAYGTDATTADNGNLIGVVDADTPPEGVDIPMGEFSFQVTKVFPAGDLPSLNDLYTLSTPPHTNAATFTVSDTETGLSITLNAGEGLFLGADGGEARGDGGVVFTFDFKASPNKTGLSVGGIGGIAKGGHEYIWPRNEKAEIGTLKLQGWKPRAVYVEKMFDSGDFSKLKLSGAA
jgi:hypothetical protein